MAMMKVSPCTVLLTTLILTTFTLFCGAHSIQASSLPPSDTHAQQELNSLSVPPQPTSPNKPPVQGSPKEAVHSPLDPSSDEKEVDDVLQDDQGVLGAEESLPETSWGLQNILDVREVYSSPRQKITEDSDELEADDSETQSSESDHIPDSEEEELRTLQEGSKTTQRKGIDDDDDDEEAAAADNTEEPSLTNLETPEEESEDAERELDSMKSASEEKSYPDDEYDGYDSNLQWTEDTDSDKPGESSNPQTFLKAHQPENLDPLLNLDDSEELRRYLDDVIVPGDLQGHDDVKRGDDVMKVPGFAPVRVIELNETIYINNTEDDNLPQFQPVPIPDKFEDYDVNRDGVISLPEVRYVTKATEGARQAFREADIDGDGWMDREEFQKAGWGLPVDSSPPPSPPQEKTAAEASAQHQGAESAPRKQERS